MKKAIAVLTALSLCVAPATAQEQRVPNVASDPLPPAKYRALGGAAVVFVPSFDMWRACGIEKVDGYVLYACARLLPNGQKFIVMPDPCETAHLEQYALIMCHELAHANGDWPWDHPAK